jgi:hypothetical protein
LFSRNLHSRLAGKEVKFFGDVALHVWMCLNECVKWCVSSTPLSLNICLVRRRRMKGEKFELNIYLIYKRRWNFLKLIYYFILIWHSNITIVNNIHAYTIILRRKPNYLSITTSLSTRFIQLNKIFLYLKQYVCAWKANWYFIFMYKKKEQIDMINI